MTETMRCPHKRRGFNCADVPCPSGVSEDCDVLPDVIALDLAIREIWKVWKVGTYCEVKNCTAMKPGGSRKFKCGKNDKLCREEIRKHYIALAKKKAGK